MAALPGTVPRMMRPAPGQNYPRTGFPLEGRSGKPPLYTAPFPPAPRDDLGGWEWAGRAGLLRVGMQLNFAAGEGGRMILALSIQLLADI